ncbi:polysaccharide pyruvyl transferase family protein [Streptomyces sp. NPDC060194]|uniref:polysaccharide pyruvyl transferase family protein n=1 Tax=Streptomyces sp. NPDC060194 TaxID=3347069 RepID=UPI00366895F1
MKRILIRSGKSPFRVTSHEEFIHQDLFGTNSGNLLFSDAAHKILLTPNTEVTSNGIRTDMSAERARQINEEYDVFVVPLANAFRPQFQASLDRLSTLIEQLTIPVVVLGVGAQVGEDYDTEVLRPMEESVRRFVRAVLSRSATIGVRGELTASYLRGLGFGETDIIGCPSMFLHGGAFPAPRDPGTLDADSRIAINLSPDAIPVGDVAGIAQYAQERFPHLTYYGQNLVDAELLFWGDLSAASGDHQPFPLQLTHPLFREGKVRVPLDPKVWLEELAGHDFAYGTRIHGNIAALLAGTPAVVLAHDSRTLELCRYFDLPHRMLSELSADTDPADLYAAADFSGMLDGHGERFGRFTAFLDKHALENTFDHGDGGTAFDARLADLDLPPTLRLWDGSDDGALAYRFNALRAQQERNRAAAGRRLDGLNRKNQELVRRLGAAEKRQTALQEQLAAVQKQVAALQKQAAATDKRVSGIDKRVLVRIGPALRRRARLPRSGGR